MSNMPPKPLSRNEAITDIIESVAKEQEALGHILIAESEKLQKIICHVFVTPKELLKANRSVDRLVNSVARLEMVLQSKLELFEDCLCPCYSGLGDAEGASASEPAEEPEA